MRRVYAASRADAIPTCISDIAAGGNTADCIAGFVRHRSVIFYASDSVTTAISDFEVILYLSNAVSTSVPHISVVPEIADSVFCRIADGTI